MKICPYCGGDYTNKRKHFAECPDRPHGPHVWTDEEKKRQSEKRKLFLKNNPDKHPWRMHKYKKFISKPCMYLKDRLREKGIEFKEEVIIPQLSHNYSIDIYIPELMVGIEVNGNQHYDEDGHLTPYYQERHDIIEQSGMKLIELPYRSCYNNEIIDTIELLWRNRNLNCLLNSKICEFESRQQYYAIERTELKRMKEARRIAYYEKAKAEGRISADGKVRANKTTISQWNHYKTLIESSNVDITKFGWVDKMVKSTGLTKRQIRNTVRKFNIPCYSKKTCR